MKIKAVLFNGFKVNISFLREGIRQPEFQKEGRADVEICRTVFADNPPGMDYNDHKHNRNRQGALWENNITGGFAMFEGLAADTRVITYLMAAVGVLGILAKIVNHFTLNRLVRAAGNMPKSMHKLIKLVRAKYEHACMIRDSVENIDVFVEKYIYEYRGFLFRIHTWRQIEILSVWFAGILAALGASVLYFSSGFSESVYQYIAAGIAEMVLLSVVMRLSDEPYKVNAVKMYMTDYLENICTFRLRRQSSRERESIDVISAEGSGKGVQTAEENAEYKRPEYAKQETRTAGREVRSVRSVRRKGSSAEQEYAEPAYAGASYAGANRTDGERMPPQSAVADNAAEDPGMPEVKAAEGNGLPINIEGEPKDTAKAEAVRGTARHTAQSREEDDRPALREEAIRQILEEFLA